MLNQLKLQLKLSQPENQFKFVPYKESYTCASAVITHLYSNNYTWQKRISQ
jgi:hypothetical protein